jgi:hypothetical protein
MVLCSCNYCDKCSFKFWVCCFYVCLFHLLSLLFLPCPPSILHWICTLVFYFCYEAFTSITTILYIHVTHLHKYLYYSSDFRLINEAYCKDFDVGNCHHCVMGWPSTNFCHSTKSYLVGGFHVIACFTFNFLIWFLTILFWWGRAFLYSKLWHALHLNEDL